MPYYFRRRKYYWRRRPWTWRPRYTFRRRPRWRRRKYRVRRKLNSIKIKEFQPTAVRKCCIKGIQPLFLANRQRLGNNYRQWEHSIIPEFWPGGGGFSITRYNLEALYEQHQLDRNWWTSSNNNLPLCRYNGCKIKFYKSLYVDYVVNYNTCLPMLATQMLYTSCQPSFMMMNKRCIFVPSKKTEPRGKPYKVLRLGPPSQLQNKWYFAKDLIKTGLVMLTASACSFDNYYINNYWESNNITFFSLNPFLFKRHNFQQPGTQGYKASVDGTLEKTLWATSNGTIHTPKFSELIYLGNSKQYQKGEPYGTTINNWDNYFTNKSKWGNIFYNSHLITENRVYVSTKPLNTLKTTYNSNPQQLVQAGDFTTISMHELIQCRYSPDRDTGQNTKIYLKSVIRDESGWEEPTNQDLILEGFPLWCILFGWFDWQRKLQTALKLDRDWVLVIQSDFISPKQPYYILVDKDFLKGNSPHLGENELTDTDKENWYPCCLFQEQTVNNIISTGPGIAKFGDKKTVEAKIKYSFYWKFGGCPPKMDTVTDPADQPVYPVPNNESQMYSLQNPNTEPETYLYQFDVRKETITKPATKRIKTDHSSTKPLFSAFSGMDPPAALTTQETQTSSEAETDSEKEEETLLLKLRQQRKKRKQLQLKLLQLMEQT